VIVADCDDGLPAYLHEHKDELVVKTEGMDEPKPVRETWGEYVCLVEHLKECDVEPVEDWGTPFDDVLAEKVSVSP